MNRKEVIDKLSGLCDDLDDNCPVFLLDALDLLKNDEEQTRRKLQHIADVQLSYAPIEVDDEIDLKYKSGMWNGLQLAWEILTEDHSEASYYCEVKTNEQKNGLADHHRKTSEEGNSGTQG